MGAQHTAQAHPQGGPKQKRRRTGGSWLLVVLPVLVILLLVTSVLLGSRLYDSATRDQHAVQLGVGETGQVELFKVEYEGGQDGSDDITVSGADGQKVVAPGTGVDYDVRLANDDDTHIDYVLVPEATFLTEDRVPIEVRLVDPYGNYLLGSADEWAPIEDLNGIEHYGVVRQDEVVTYSFSWRWQYEQGTAAEDAYDTYLGNGGSIAMPGVEVSFTTESSASTKLPHTGKGFLHGLSDWGCCVCCYLVWVLLIVCCVLLAYVWRQHRALVKLNEELDDMEGREKGAPGGSAAEPGQPEAVK